MFGLALLDWRRRRLLRKAPPGPMRDYLATPFPKASTDWRGVEFLALDLETTGLDQRRDAVLSVGHVTLRVGHIELASAEHRLVRIAGEVPEASAIIHQITDDQAAQGEDLEAVLAKLLATLAGKVMIAHHARVETGFIGAACRRVYGVGLVVPVVDTMRLAQRWFDQRHIDYKGSDLRLHALSERYNLPRYAAHNALFDALAAAELFLAQAEIMCNGRTLPLRRVLT
jgi:DNA polymerase III subunit epsilon